jgi:hypothetical protein
MLTRLLLDFVFLSPSSIKTCVTGYCRYNDAHMSPGMVYNVECSAVVKNTGQILLIEGTMLRSECAVLRRAYASQI